MKTETSQWLVLITGVMLAAGGGCGQSTTEEASLTPGSPRPFIFYDEAGNPGSTPALSELEFQEIVDWVATQTPDPIWLIRVGPSTGYGTRHNMVAYLVPDEATPRIRVGRAYNVPMGKDKPRLGSLWKYAQVSLAPHTFEKRLTKPSTEELPFKWPAVVDPNSDNKPLAKPATEELPRQGLVVVDHSPEQSSSISNEEVIAIVDFAHHHASYELFPGMSTEAQGLPILRVSSEGDVVRVKFGFQHGFLWGFGTYIEIQCTATEYKVVGSGKWIS